jgi:hypothetical protein
VDKTSNCNIIKHSLLDDLVNYRLNAGSIIYDNGSSYNITYNTSSLSSMVDVQISGTYKDIWQPLFIDNDTYVNNKLLSNHGSCYNSNTNLTSGKLGIENIISFTPQFKSWTATNSVMSIDWFLNGDNTPYAVYYGILGWFRKNDELNPNTLGNGSSGAAMSIDYFPKGTRLVKKNALDGAIYIKVDDSTLYRVDAQNKTLTNGAWVFNTEQGTTNIKVSDLGSNPVFQLADRYSVEYTSNNQSERYLIQNNNIFSSSLNTDVTLWIPDGDCFFYHNSEQDKEQALNNGISSRSYISSGLYSKYAAIYRILTLDEKRSFFRKNLRKARNYKRIAHALSTSPFIGNFSIEALDYPEIRNLIKNYVSSESTRDTANGNSSSIATEIKNFRLLLLNVSRLLQNTTTDNSNKSLYLDTKFNTHTINNNIIHSASELFNKLIVKYGAHLLITSNAAVSAKQDILKFDNTGIVISQVMDSYCNKTFNNKKVYNNQNITFSNTKFETKLDEFNSNINILVNNQKKNSIPLYDAGKPLYYDSSTGESSFLCPSLVYKGEIPGQYRTSGGYYNDNANDTIRSNNKTFYDFVYSTPIDDFVETSLSTDPQKSHCSFLLEKGISLNAITFAGVERSYNEFSVLLLESYLSGQISFFWEQISGPQGTFGKNELLSGTSNSVVFYTNYTGRYIFQCMVATPFGTFKKQKTVYVVDGRQLVPDGNGGMMANVVSYLRYWDQEYKVWVDPPPKDNRLLLDEMEPLILDKDKVTSNTSKINKLAISNYHGVVYPVKTDFSVREYIGSFGNLAQDEVYSLSSDYIFSFANDYQYNSQGSLRLEFLPNNTTIKLHSIWLEKIRTNNNDECSQCFSMYIPKLKSRKVNVKISSTDSQGNVINTSNYNFNKTIRANKYPEGFSLRYYEWDTARNMAKCNLDYGGFDFPTISTTKAPKIKNYGGYSKSFIDSIGVNINGLTKPNVSTQDNGIVAGSGASAILPPITGFKLDYRANVDPSTWKVCYQKAVTVTGTGLVIPFKKGVLHPNSGWISCSGGTDYAIHANRCGVLKFNPGARDSFSFIGPQITRLRPGSVNSLANVIEPKVFSSSITLGIARDIQWDPECDCGPATEGGSTTLYNENQKHKDLVDIQINRSNSNHGYRILAGGKPKPIEYPATNNHPIVSDEFLTDQTQTNFSYSFAVTGPHSLPEKIASRDGRKHFRIPRVNGFGIKDIEVKLNFLNYVNTKNIVVWLDVDLVSSEQAARFSSTSTVPSSPLRNNKEFLDQTLDPRIFFGNYSPGHASLSGALYNSQIENYITDLVGMNSPPTGDSQQAGGKFKLFLLNQESLQNNNYNFSVKFSDHASKFNTASDMNMLGPGYDHPLSHEYHMTAQIYREQNIIRSNDELLPTIASTGYSDRQHCEYSSVIRHNKLNVGNATFSKFVANSLFRNKGPTDGPCPERAPKQKEGDLDGKTTFTLNIMVLDEEDDMNVLDSTINSKYISGLESTENKSKSHLLYNSLCNWELILHVGPTRDPIPNTNPSLASYGNNDALSLIDYKKDPSYPGYSYIADLTHLKHLLPIANYNAPYCSIADSALCLTSQDDPTGQGVMIQPPVFPTYALVQIIAGLAAFGALTGGTLVGALAGLDMAVNNPAYRAIFDYFKESAFSEELTNQGRQIYSPSFAKYPFGSPEKMLINFKKPNSLWYSAEASIFKYENTPILKPDRYKFLRLSKDNLDFSFSIVNSYEDLVDPKFIKTIVQDCESKSGDPEFPSGMILPMVYRGVMIHEGDIVRIKLNNINPNDKIDPKTGSGIVRCDTINDTYVAISADVNGSGGVWPSLETDATRLCQTSNHFLQHNVLLGKDNIIDDGDFGQKFTILIPSKVPYDIFQKDDRLYDPDSPITSVSKIVKKGLIFKDNRYYSLFVMDHNMSSFQKLCPTNDIVLFLAFKNETTIQDKKSKGYNIWGLDSANHNVFDDTVSIAPTTHSVGSYGDMSLFVNKNMLSNNLHFNSLQSIYDVFNNRENDKIKHNNIKIFQDTNSNLTYLNQYTNTYCYGFSYSKEEFNSLNLRFRKERTNKDFFYIESNTDDSANSEIVIDAIEQSSCNNEIPNNFCIIRTDHQNFGSINPILPAEVVKGELEIENVYTEYVPMKSITDTEFSWIVNRLATIESTGIDTNLESSVGSAGGTSIILNSSKLEYIQKHYNKLEEDPIDCYTQSPANQGACNKKKTYKKIKELYDERNSIIQLLEEQAIKIAPTGYKLKSTLPIADPRRISPNILPKVEPVISGIDGTSYGPVYIYYRKVNEDHYWINLDPKQSCFQDFESNPKVLISTTYKCQEANPLLLQTTAYVDNNICPFFTTKPGQQISYVFGNDENLTSSVDEYTYSISTNKIDQEKARYVSEYPAITGWTKFEKKRWFNINGDQTMDMLLGPGQEVTVESTETYWVPLTNENQGNDQSGDTLTLPGMPGCQTNIGSPPGKGLVVSSDKRVGKPTRIQNIVNLDQVNDLSVMVKRVPRLLRGADLLSTIYRYGSKAEFRPDSAKTMDLIPFEVDLTEVYGNINNSLYIWTALQRDGTEFNRLAPATLPDFFKLQNEMTFRAFFGSVDKIENKASVAPSHFPWELIPYEYE